MPTYTVKIKGKAHQFDSDLTDNEAIIRLRKLVKKGIVKGPFAENLLQRALNGQLTQGWLNYCHFFAVSKKARQEFGSDKREDDRTEQRKADYTTDKPYEEAARSLAIVFGHSGAVQALKDVLRTTARPFVGKWRGILFALEALPDPEAKATGKRVLFTED